MLPNSLKMERSKIVPSLTLWILYNVRTLWSNSSKPDGSLRGCTSVCRFLSLLLQGLVERTRAHPKYAKNYRFETDLTWIEASPCGDACAGLPQVVALDCEMCMSEVSRALLGWNHGPRLFWRRMRLLGRWRVCRRLLWW